MNASAPSGCFLCISGTFRSLLAMRCSCTPSSITPAVTKKMLLTFHGVMRAPSPNRPVAAKYTSNITAATAPSTFSRGEATDASRYRAPTVPHISAATYSAAMGMYSL